MRAEPLSLPLALPEPGAPPAVALAGVIAVWSELRHPRLADLADRIEEPLLAAAPRPALPASKRRADLYAWRALEGTGDPLDFHRLAEAARGGGQDDVRRQVKALAARRDPRLARALLALLARPPYAGVKSRALLADLLEELVATRDRRAAGPAHELASRYLGVVLSGTGRWMVAQLQEAAHRLAAAEHGELTGELAAACAALEARYGVRAPDPTAAAQRRTLAELLAEVYAAPDDDGPRLVLADALLERGEPRGELIALQIARARGEVTAEARAREEELLADKARLAAWAQPLSTGGTCTFERGFPSEIRLSRLPAGLLDDPAWATITAVVALSQVSQASALRICALPGVRSIEILHAPLLAQLCREPRPWTRIAFDDERAPPLEQLANLPALRELLLLVREPPPPGYLATPALAGLRSLMLRYTGRTAPLELPPDLEHLHLTCTRELPRLYLQRLPRLRTLRLEYQTSSVPLELPASLEELRLFAPRALLPRIAVAQPSRLRAALLRMGELAPGALRELGSVEELELMAIAGLPSDALEGLVRLRKLTLHSREDTTALDVLSPLERLEELEVVGTGALRLEGLPLRSLAWKYVALDHVPVGLPLARARVTMPETLAELARFVQRFPALWHLDLEAGFRSELAHGDDANWRALTAILAASGVQRCSFRHRYDEVELERDAEGALSRLRIPRADSPLGEVFARALPRVTAIACPQKLPAKLAKLVR